MNKLTVRLLIGTILFFTAWYLVTLAVPWAPSPWPPVYWAEETRARVIDADTKAPLEGVIVAANWELRDPWIGPVGQVAVMEAVTDKDGRFIIPAWGPRLRGSLTGRLTFSDPKLLFFKSGYIPHGVENKEYQVSNSPFRRSDWAGEIIKLKRFQGSDQEYAKKLSGFDNDLDFAFKYHNCSWKKIPRILVAMHHESERLEAKGVRYVLGNPRSIEERAEMADQKQCGSYKDFLRSYLP